jgi:hypothetical protein
MKTPEEQDNSAKQQARAQLAHIKDMVARLNTAMALEDANEDTDESSDSVREEIQQNALSVDVRTGWHSVGTTKEQTPEQFTILLCTGGPAVRLRGALSAYGDPEDIDVEYADWGTPWTRLDDTGIQADFDALLSYAQQFYFGE